MEDRTLHCGTSRWRSDNVGRKVVNRWSPRLRSLTDSGEVQTAVILPTREDVLPIIQLAITPVILMSSIGAVLLSMTNRMGRVVDRTRALAMEIRQGAKPDEREHLVSQLQVMFRRAKLLRLAMTMSTLSVFVSGLLVVVIFVSALTRSEMSAAILVLFVVSISFLLLGLATFIRDVFLSLTALKRDVDRALLSPK